MTLDVIAARTGYKVICKLAEKARSVMPPRSLTSLHSLLAFDSFRAGILLERLEASGFHAQNRKSEQIGGSALNDDSKVAVIPRAIPKGKKGLGC